MPLTIIMNRLGTCIMPFFKEGLNGWLKESWIRNEQVEWGRLPLYFSLFTRKK
jgi:hypothetical protein